MMILRIEGPDAERAVREIVSAAEWAGLRVAIAQAEVLAVYSPGDTGYDYEPTHFDTLYDGREAQP